MSRLAEFGALYAAEQARLRRRLTRMTGDPAAASDLLHDIFLRLWRRADAPEGSDAAYLMRSARNAAIDHNRSERVRADYASGLVPEQVAGAIPTPEAICAAREGLRRADDAIRALPERTRHIFLLNRVHGRTYNEIGETFAISASAVEKHMARALAALRRAVEEI